jgi:hypothetical protein
MRAAPPATVHAQGKTPNFVSLSVHRVFQLDEESGQSFGPKFAFKNAFLNPNPVFLKNFGDPPPPAIVGHVVRHHDQMRHQRHPRNET